MRCSRSLRRIRQAQVTAIRSPVSASPISAAEGILQAVTILQAVRTSVFRFAETASSRGGKSATTAIRTMATAAISTACPAAAVHQRAAAVPQEARAPPAQQVPQEVRDPPEAPARQGVPVLRAPPAQQVPQEVRDLPVQREAQDQPVVQAVRDPPEAQHPEEGTVPRPAAEVVDQTEAQHPEVVDQTAARHPEVVDQTEARHPEAAAVRTHPPRGTISTPSAATASA